VRKLLRAPASRSYGEAVLVEAVVPIVSLHPEQALPIDKSSALNSAPLRCT
jgi:hypothetical protein